MKTATYAGFSTKQQDDAMQLTCARNSLTVVKRLTTAKPRLRRSIWLKGRLSRMASDLLSPHIMAIASTSRRIFSRLHAGLLIGMIVQSLVSAEFHPAAAAEITSAFIVPAQLSMGRNLWAPTPATRKRMTTPAKPQPGLTEREQRQLADAMNQLTLAERKRLAKAVKRMTPEQRRQFVFGLKRQLAKRGPASQLAKRAR